MEYSIDFSMQKGIPANSPYFSGSHPRTPPLTPWPDENVVTCWVRNGHIWNKYHIFSNQFMWVRVQLHYIVLDLHKKGRNCVRIQNHTLNFTDTITLAVNTFVQIHVQYIMRKYWRYRLIILSRYNKFQFKNLLYKAFKTIFAFCIFLVLPCYLNIPRCSVIW